MLLRVLIALDSDQAGRRVRALLPADCVRPAASPPAEPVLERMLAEPADLAVVSVGRLAPDPADIAARACSLPEGPEVVVLTSGPDPGLAADLAAAGCVTVLDEGIEEERLGRALASIVRRREARLERHDAAPPAGVRTLRDFESSSPPMRQLLEEARRAAGCDSTVLMSGETGTGKEWLANAIHDAGHRRGHAFVELHCASVPESLLESELFGHERGAFTGAVSERRGAFELAHRGTIFLDEIGDVSPSVQGKLLRLLQRAQFRRVGGQKPVRLDVRVIAATNRDLRADVRERRFREDLLYRLAVVELHVPPLRARTEDIPRIVERCLPDLLARANRARARIAPAAMAALQAYSWPGNVRELMNVLERALLLGRTDVIGLEDLPVLGPPASAGCAVPKAMDADHELAALTLEEACGRAVRACERDYLVDVLRRYGGRVGEAAARAGVPARTFYAKLRRHGLDKDEFRGSAPRARRPRELPRAGSNGDRRGGSMR